MRWLRFWIIGYPFQQGELWLRLRTWWRQHWWPARIRELEQEREWWKGKVEQLEQEWPTPCSHRILR